MSDTSGRWEPLAQVKTFGDRPGERETHALAYRATLFGIRRPGFPPGRFPNLRWFDPQGATKVAQFDQEDETIWLSVELRDLEVLKSLGHELEHLAQWRRGWPFTEAVAIAAEERFVQEFAQEDVNLLAQAAASGRGPSADEMRVGARMARVAALLAR
jgi:hypothetical protein